MTWRKIKTLTPEETADARTRMGWTHTCRKAPDGCCPVCGVSMRNPCPECGQAGYHDLKCPEVEG